MKVLVKRIPLLYVICRPIYAEMRHLLGTLYLWHVLRSQSVVRIVIGAARHADAGWIATERFMLDLLQPHQWARLFARDSIDALLAEHVWEHLSTDDGRFAAHVCFRYLKPNGYVRVAVPDGLHPDPQYIEWVKVGGIGTSADDHKVLYTYRTLRHVFEQAGFAVELLEYFDEAGTFHYHEWSRDAGTIRRSCRFDSRNQAGDLRYTSLLLDARKPLCPSSNGD